MGIFGTLSKLMSGSLRSALSRYPSSATPQLKAAWKRPVTKWYATPQPYTSPLTIQQGNYALNGETHEMRREYREWSFREPPVKASLLTKCLAVASLDPQITPDDKKDSQDVAAAKWVDWAVNHAAGGWGGLFRNLLLPATIDGFSTLEPVWDEVDAYHRRYAKWWTVKRFAMIDTDTLRFKLDEFRQVTAVRPTTGLTGYIELPPETYLIFTHLKMFENPFGISDLRAVVRDVRALEAAIKLRQILLSNWSGPFIKASHADESTRRQMMSILERARANGYIVLPAGSELDVLNLATSSPQVFDSAIAFYREQIVSGINGSYLQLLASDSERGSSLVAKSVSELFTWWLALEVAEVINNQLIPSLVRPNFGNSVGLPRLSLGGINEAVVTAALDRFAKLQSMGLDLSKEQVTTVGGAETPSTPEDTLKPPQAQQAAPPGGGGGNDPFAGILSDGERRVQMSTEGGADRNQSPFPNTQAFWEAKAKSLYATLPAESTVRARDDAASTFAEWRPYTNPRTQRSGWISEGGQVRYDDPRTNEDNKKVARDNADSALAEAINDPSRLSQEHVERLIPHLQTLTRDRARELAKQLSLKVGGKKAELAERIVADIKARREKTGGKGDALEKEPPAPEKPKAIDLKHADASHPVAQAIANDPHVKEVFDKMSAAVAEVTATADKETVLDGKRQAAYDQWKKLDDDFKATIDRYKDVVNQFGMPIYPPPEFDKRTTAGKEAAKKYEDRQDEAVAALSGISEASSVAWEKFKAAREDHEAVRKELEGANDKIRSALEEHMKPENPAKFGSRYDAPARHPDSAQVTTEATKATFSFAEGWINKIVNLPSVPPISYGVATDGRGFCSFPVGVGSGNWYNEYTVTTSGNVLPGMDDFDAKRTAIHELGHVIEHSKPGLLQRCKDFIEYRCAGEVPTSLKEKYGGRYTEAEFGRKDDFEKVLPEHSAYYLGKTYADATEVISMGLENLWHNPAKLFTKDPEFAAFLVSALRS